MDGGMGSITIYLIFFKVRRFKEESALRSIFQTLSKFDLDLYSKVIVVIFKLSLSSTHYRKLLCQL